MGHNGFYGGGLLASVPLQGVIKVVLGDFSNMEYMPRALAPPLFLIPNQITASHI